MDGNDGKARQIAVCRRKMRVKIKEKPVCRLQKADEEMKEKREGVGRMLTAESSLPGIMNAACQRGVVREYPVDPRERTSHVSIDDLLQGHRPDKHLFCRYTSLPRYSWNRLQPCMEPTRFKSVGRATSYHSLLSGSLQKASSDLGSSGPHSVHLLILVGSPP